MRIKQLHIIYSGLIILFLTIGCDEMRMNFDKGIIPLTPVNFTSVNSEYDDYNSAGVMDEYHGEFSLVFSTNRNSEGAEFDFIQFHCFLYSNLITGRFDIDAFDREDDFFTDINSSANELGPYFSYNYYSSEYTNPSPSETRKRFFYTGDEYGNMDIYFTEYRFDNYGFISERDPEPLNVINSAFDDGYLTIHHNEVFNKETVYFTSNREGNFDIYRAVSEENKFIDNSENVLLSKTETLNSNADDKCPFIQENMMVFTSDRPGGYGGFDLYYSVYDGTTWGTPVNFGESINSAYDEYRPVIILTDDDRFLNNLMIFSSNRPGGEGMFDLYYAGVKKSFLPED